MVKIYFYSVSAGGKDISPFNSQFTLEIRSVTL